MSGDSQTAAAATLGRGDTRHIATATSAPTIRRPVSSVACRRRRMSSSEAPWDASASGCSLMSLKEMWPARTAARSLLRCQSIPASQTGQRVLYQTTRRWPVMLQLAFDAGGWRYATHGALPSKGPSEPHHVLSFSIPIACSYQVSIRAQLLERPINLRCRDLG